MDIRERTPTFDCVGLLPMGHQNQSNLAFVDFKTVQPNSLGEPMSSKYPQIVPEPSSFRKPISEMFDGLDAFEQRALIDRLALLPHQIDHLATEGVIHDEIVQAFAATGSR